MVLVIPFKRPLYPPSYMGEKTLPGDDILAVKRTISRAGFWPWGQFDDVYYEKFSKGDRNRLGMLIKGKQGVVGLQKRLKIQPTGFYGKATHEASLKLRVPKGLPHEGELIWDQSAINLYRGFEDLTPAEEKVKEIFSWWQYLVDREPSVHYDQGRPINIILRGEKPPRIPLSEDCSGTFLSCAWLAGAKTPDPWYGYKGYGSTDSLVHGGIPIKESEIDKYCKTHYVGVFYGPAIWNTKHMVAAKDSKTLYSHGKEAGPGIIRNNLHYHSYTLIAIRAYPVI
jgi:hypothetical protein